MRMQSALPLASALLLFAAAAFAQQPAPSYAPGPVPLAIRNAHTLFLANGGADRGLFPHPFSGTPDRGYNELYAKLQHASGIRLEDSPANADLVLDIELQAPLGPKDPDKERGSSDPHPEFRLTLYDAHSPFRLWVITESIHTAFKQETHDRNFDQAIDRVFSDFEALRRAAPNPR